MENLPLDFKLRNNGIIHTTENSHVYLGEYNNENVVLKMFPSKFPPEDVVRSYQKDYQINALLYSKHPDDFSKPIKFKNEENQLYSVKSELGVSLQQYQEHTNQFNVKEFLQLAIKICQSLHYIHQENVLHCDVKPQNILYEKETDRCSIIDFESSFLVSLKNPSISKNERGTVHYMSPEQTGRTTKEINKTSDIYSLGVSFFEMITGEVPFKGEITEVVYAHIAKQPPLLSKFRDDIPKPIEDIIQKMMMKNQHERYYSVSGIKKELEFILKNLENPIELGKFKAGIFDIKDTFAFENKIYGREKEIQMFKEKIKNIEMTGKTELIMISGVSGIGKSSLVNEILSIKKDNMILKGKFDQFLQSPFFSFIQILKKYFQILSSKSKEHLKIQRTRILRVLENNGKIITELIPQSEFILGEQEELQKLPSESEEQKRFIKTLVQFFSMIAEDSLLCLFLDDLQWADVASLELIEALIKQKNSNILIIGAYRDNEVSPTHPMIAILEPIIKENNYDTIHLDILNIEYIEKMLSDSLNSNNVKELTNLIYQKTNGNPFFIKEFVFNLYDKKLIKFNYSNENWEWNLNEIAKSKFSENVVEFMIEKIHEFSNETKKILNLASCIGNEFKLNLLSSLHKKSQEEVYSVLLEAVSTGWLFEIENSFKFVHDRLQQAAYEIYEDKKKIHYEIGLLFLENAEKNDEMETYMFDIVNHLNSSGNYFKDKKKLIKLNLEASQLALKSHAFDPALNYSNFAKSLLTEDSWTTDHELTFQVTSIVASNLYISRKMDESSKIYEELLSNGNTKTELLKTTIPYINLLLLCQNFPRAIEISLKMISHYEVTKDIPTFDLESLEKWTKNVYNEVNDFMKDKNTTEEFLSSIPKQSNEEMSLFCAFLFTASIPFYQTMQFQKCLATSVLGVKTCIKEGFNDFVPALLSSGALFSHAYYESSTPKKWILFASDLVKLIKDPNLVLYSIFYISTGNMFSGTMEKAISTSNYGYTFALSVGEYTYGSYCNVTAAELKVANGCNYKTLHNHLDSSKQIIYSTGNYFIGDMAELTRTKCAIMSGKSQSFEPKLVVPGFETYPFSRALYYRLKVFALYLLKDFDGAKEAIDKMKNFSHLETIGSCQHYEAPIHEILVYFALSPKNYLNNIKENVNFLKKHYEINPDYFGPKYAFVDALQESIINNDEIQIFRKFQNAIKATDSSDFMSALTHEYFGEFCKNIPEFFNYGKYLENEAFNKYKRMGAVCKYRHLERRSSTVSDHGSSSSPSTSTLTKSGTTTSDGGSIDLQTIIKSSSTISEGLDKEKLLKKLNEVIVQNAGAEKGYIILKKSNKYIIKSAFSNENSFKGEEINENCKIISMQIFNQCLNQRDIVILKNAKSEMKNDIYIQENKVKSVLCAPIIKGKTVFGVLYLENNSMEGTFNSSRKFIFQHVLSQVAIAIENISLFEDVKTINTAYARFLPSEFLNQLSKKDVRNIQPSESVEKKMTVMFSDIRNFTSITDKMNAKESFEFVNEILKKLAPSISSNHGFVDKFIGDCVMAIFPTSPLNGVKAGIQMLKQLNELNKKKEFPIHIGVGLAFGNVMLGTLGFEKRLDATVISNTVNTASRMESLTKTFGVNMIITEDIYDEIKFDSEIKCIFLGSFYLKGQFDAKKLFEICLSENDVDDEIFQKGIKLFSEKRFDESIETFKLIKNQNKMCSYYINVCELYQLIELPEHWKGEIKISKDGDAQPFSNDQSKTTKDHMILIHELMGNPEKLQYLYEAAKKINANIDQ